MVILVDTGTIPPALQLIEKDDFTSFKVTVVLSGHTWVEPSVLEALAPSADDQWRSDLQSMLAYARAKGWTDEHGSVRAHIEVVP